MLIKRDGKIRIIGGSEDFRSAFRSGNRRTRNLAHRRLIEEMERRGYWSNGVPRKRFNGIDLDFSSSPCEGYRKLNAILEELTDQAKQLLDNIRERSQETTTFWGNPELNQKIPLGILIAATDLWPLEEVLEMVPDYPATLSEEEEQDAS
jgi:hypothetical protein